MITSNELKALVSLLDDDDTEVSFLVEKQIKDLGFDVIPQLESAWEEQALNPNIQRRLEELIHEMQFGSFQNGLLAWFSGTGDDLLEGMWLLSRYLYPDLEFQKLKNEINQIYFSAWLQMREEIHPEDAIRILNNVIFEEFKFSGNTKNFHSPANSMLNQVLESKKGNPISLSVIYILVAQKLNLPVFGVNLPSLFIVTYESPQLQFYINPFNKGLSFGKKDIDQFLKQMNLEPKPIFYQACNNKDILKRSLLNLIVSFQKNGENEKVKELNLIYDNLGY